MSTGSSNRTEQPQSRYGSSHRKGTGEESQNTPVLVHFSTTSTPHLPALPRTAAMSPVDKQDDELEHSQGAGIMEPQSEKTDLLVINSKLTHAESEGRITDVGRILRELKELPIVNKDLLHSTGIYNEVHRLSFHADPSLRSFAQSLFEDWTVLFFPVDKILNDISATTCTTHPVPNKRWIVDITSQLVQTMTAGQTLEMRRILHELGERPIMDKKLLRETSIFETVFKLRSHSDLAVQSVSRELIEKWKIILSKNLVQPPAKCSTQYNLPPQPPEYAPPNYNLGLLNTLHKSTQPKEVLKSVVNKETSKAFNAIKALEELCGWVEACTEIDQLNAGRWKASIENTHETIRQYADQLLKLIEVNNELRLSAKIKEMEFTGLQKDLITTSKQLEAYETDLKRSKIEVEIGKETLIELQKKFELSTAEDKASKLKIVERIKQLEDGKRTEDADLDSWKEKESKQIQLALAAVKARLVEAKAEKAAAERRSVSTLRAQEKEIDRLKIDLEAKKGEVETVKQSLKGFKLRLAELDHLKHDFDAKTGEADAAKRSTAQKVGKLEQRVLDLTAQIKELQDTIHLQKQARIKLKEDKDKEVQEKQTLSQSLQATNDELRELRTAYDDVLQELHTSQDQVQQLRAALKRKPATSSTVTRELDAPQNDHFLKQEIRHIKHKIGDAENTKETLQITLKDLGAEIARITKEMDIVELDRAAAQTAAQSLAQTVAQTTAQQNMQAEEEPYRSYHHHGEAAHPQPSTSRSRSASMVSVGSNVVSSSSTPALPFLSPRPLPLSEMELPVQTLDGPLSINDEVQNRPETAANGRDQPEDWARVARRASTRIIRIIPADAPSRSERQPTGNSQRGRGSSNGPNNYRNRLQTGTENATRGRGRREHENFVRSRRDEHNYANL
jgi:hypothetical protein